MSMLSVRQVARNALAVVAIGLAVSGVVPAVAQDAGADAEETYENIRDVIGVVPGFAAMYPKAGIEGAWAVTRDFLLQDTALDLKTKALISLAVAAQIPCQYCIWSDTRDALASGASEEEIREAVTVAALTRHWSTIFNGYQIDFETFKRELGGE
jgi:AhpD family alkylhydroperoxidase